MSEITPTKSKAQIWRERIEEQVQSGRSVRAFCEERLISPHAFHYWKRKFPDLIRRRRGGRFMALTGGFYSAVRASNPLSRGLRLDFPRIHLPNGVRIELGAGLESGAVSQFIRSLCGVGHPPKDGHSAKP